MALSGKHSDGELRSLDRDEAMTLSKIQAGAAAALALVSAFSMASSAMAMEPGYCAPTAEFSAEMRAENQKPLVTAGRVNGGAFSPIQIFTSNADGDGYLIEGDRPVGQTSQNMCVTLKFANVKLYDASKPIPEELFTGGKLDQNLRRGQKSGSGVVLQANVIQNNRPVAIATVVGDVRDRTGALMFLASSNPEMRAVFENLTYTPTANALLKMRTPTAPKP